MKCTYSCHSPEHTMARAAVPGRDGRDGGRVDGRGPGLLLAPGRGRAARQGPEARSSLFNMHGGLSQLESWDPKPGTETGGPFRAIEHVGSRDPDLGAAAERRQADAPPLPGARREHQRGRPRQGRLPDDDRPAADARRRLPDLRGRLRQGDGARSGLRCRATSSSPPVAAAAAATTRPTWAPSTRASYLGNGNPPQYTTRPGQVSEPMDAARNDFRRRVNERFLNRRRTAVTEAYTYSYEQALQLMEQKDVFDVTKEPAKDHERYGKYDLGRHCLLARRLLEKGRDVRPGLALELRHPQRELQLPHRATRRVRPVVRRVRRRPRRPRDARQHPDRRPLRVRPHAEHQPSLRPRPLVARLDGRVAGGKVHRGVAYGKTNAKGTEVVDGQVDHANLFHTYLQAVGVDSTDSFEIEGRDVPIADPASKMIRPILA